MPEWILTLRAIAVGLGEWWKQSRNLRDVIADVRCYVEIDRLMRWSTDVIIERAESQLERSLSEDEQDRLASRWLNRFLDEDDAETRERIYRLLDTPVRETTMFLREALQDLDN